MTTEYARPVSCLSHAPATVLVDPRWLEEHLTDPGVRVVEVDVSAAAYNDGHIAGAVLWNIYGDLKDDAYRLVDAAALQLLVARSGISPDSTVVFYGYAPALGVADGALRTPRCAGPELLPRQLADSGPPMEQCR